MGENIVDRFSFVFSEINRIKKEKAEKIHSIDLEYSEILLPLKKEYKELRKILSGEQ